MEKVTYTPTEFAEIFGKEKTWAYRQLYAGKVQAVTGVGRTLIPKTEVDRLLMEAGRYLGAHVKPGKTKSSPVNKKAISKTSGATKWTEALDRRRNAPSSEAKFLAPAQGNGKKMPSPPQSEYLKAAYQRMTRK